MKKTQKNHSNRKARQNREPLFQAIAAEIGVGRKTYAYRLKKLKAALESEFPEFF